MYSIYGIHSSMATLIMGYNVIPLTGTQQSPEDYFLDNGLDMLYATPIRPLNLEHVRDGEAVIDRWAGDGQIVNLQDREGRFLTAFLMEGAA